MKQLIALTCVATLMLSACSGNPLEKKTPEDSARLLIDTSTQAMRQLGFSPPNIGDRYLKCMMHQVPATFDCNRLYQAMVDELARQGLHLRVADLTNQHFFNRIKDDLEQLAFYSL